LDYLRYFLYGPQLPDSVVESFRERLERCGDITPSDVGPLGMLARKLARAHGLAAHDAADEFYKLALEWGLSCDYSRYIYDAVRAMR
jgi:hypothetical protein